MAATRRRSRSHPMTPLRTVALLGVPLDHNSSFLRGPAEGPAAIRAALHCGAANLAAESGVDFASPGLLVDAGDVPITEGADCFAAIRAAAAAELARGRRLLSLGGDHSITSALVAAHEEVFAQLSVLQFDGPGPVRGSRATAPHTPVRSRASWSAAAYASWCRSASAR